MSSPLGLYHLAAISLVTSRARVGACRGRGAHRLTYRVTSRGAA